MSRRHVSKHSENDLVDLLFLSHLLIYRADVEVGGKSPVTLFSRSLPQLDSMIDEVLDITGRKKS
jgi:hypothetical protein